MRQPRELEKGAIYHVMSRFNRRNPSFNEEKARELFLKILSDAHGKYNFRILCYTLMETHFHMIIIPGKDESLSRIMQWILGVAAQRMNKVFGYEGHVWRGRFKSVIIRSESQLINTIRYIAKNPMEGGLAKTMEDWPYGSHGYMIKKQWEYLSHIFGMSASFLKRWASIYFLFFYGVPYG